MAVMLQALARTGDGMFAIDQAQRIVSWNNAAQSILGLQENEVLGRPCYEVLKGCDAGGDLVCGPRCRVIRAVRRNEEVPGRDLCLRRSDGRLVRCSLSVITLDEGEEDPRGVFLFRRSGTPEENGAIPMTTSEGVSEAVTPAVAIRCLGTLEVWVKGAPFVGAPLSQGKAARALRFLVHRRGHKVQRDELAEVIWPGENSEATRLRLKVLIHDLRRGLEPELAAYQTSRFVRYEDNSYALATSRDCWIDVDMFLQHVKEGQQGQRRDDLEKAQAHYEAAVALYRGPYLVEDLYEDWCSGERERLRELYISALTELASVLGARGEYARASERCEEALANDGCRESTYRSLMQYLWLDGQGHRALQVYRRCQEVMERELGVPPLAETTQVYLRIKKALSSGQP